MRRFLSALCGVLAIVALPALASAQPAHAVQSPKAEFHVDVALVVGSATLPPGDYKFQCKTIDGQDYLVVTAADDGREVSRVPCRPEELLKKVDISDFRSVPGPGGAHVLTAVRIKGEKIAHRVATN